ncbi:histidine ammonia-lyase [Vibrio sp. TBV020]|uniref:histidine ammonia-lyase n=1 Tax=Vibrio sp. TBV020 TaxID=3137398 RepID=UPI0038CDA307
MNFKRHPISLVLPLIITLTACDDGSSTNAKPNPVNAQVYSKLDCYEKSYGTVISQRVDVANCAFEDGVYVLPMNTATQKQHETVIKQVEDFLHMASSDVNQRFSNRTIVIGVTTGEPSGSTLDEEFILDLSRFADNSSTLEGIELVYTDIGGTDETLTTTAYQKMMQLFDYYIDGDDNHALGMKLKNAYDDHISLINYDSSLYYNECNYGNGYVTTPRVKGTAVDCDEDPSDSVDESNGKLDEIHDIKANLNPGAGFGVVYEYMLTGKFKTSAEWTSAPSTPLESTDGLKVGSGANNASNFSNSAFVPVAKYLNENFFVNESKIY